MLKGMLTLWSLWFVGLTIFSDTQKSGSTRIAYIGIRSLVVGISLGVQVLLRKDNIKRGLISIYTHFLAVLYLSAYVVFSFLDLPIRTTWVTILPAAFILSTPRSGRNAVFSYSVIVLIGILVFRQPINTIYIVSDVLFGFVLIGGGLIIKDLWIKSIILMLEQEEAQRTSLQNEINILEAVETFIPKGVRTMLKTAVNSGLPISTVIKAMSKPTEQHLTVLYSDYRNYSRQSANIEFVEKELIISSEKIIQFSEDQDAVVQNRGDSILAAFIGSDTSINVIRALLAAAQSAAHENERVTSLGKTAPDRYMIVTSGKAVFCSLGNEKRQEMTIAGKPANLAARLDELTKIQEIKDQIISSPCVIFDFETKRILNNLTLNVRCEEINLKEKNLEVRTYSEEKRVFLLRCSPEVTNVFKQYLSGINSRSEAA